MEKLPKKTGKAIPFPLAAESALRRKTTPGDRETARPSATTSAEERLHNRAMAGLGRRANGHVTTEVKTTYEIDPTGGRKIKSEVVTRKQNPPDLEAVIFALTNIDGVKWRAKPMPADASALSEPAAPNLSALPDDLLRQVLSHFRNDSESRTQNQPSTETHLIVSTDGK